MATKKLLIGGIAVGSLALGAYYVNSRKCQTAMKCRWVELGRVEICLVQKINLMDPDQNSNLPKFIWLQNF